MRQRKEKNKIWIKNWLAFLLASVLAVEPELVRVMASAEPETVSYEAEMEEPEELPESLAEGDLEGKLEESEAEGEAEDVEISEDSEEASEIEIEETTDTQEEETELTDRITIDEESFPDENLRKKIREIADTDADGTLSTEEL